jgi:ATP-dependent Clp protease ATP-binding subunit ClpA
MSADNWSARHITDATRRILEQIPARASDRGLHVVDGSSVVVIALWSLLLWERKVGRVALDRMGVDSFDLARAVDRLLDGKADEHPVAYDLGRPQVILLKSGEPYKDWGFDALLEPLLQRAEHEAMALGHAYVGTEHLLLAIIREASPPLSEMLLQRGVDHDRVREAVLSVLHS